ncbi:MAG: DNA repair protein RadC [Firmicutes bacterium]|nr:DNA repair protein RadC [Bacillota bacterium]
MRVEVVRVELVRERSVSYAGRTIRSPRDAVRMVRPLIERSDRERFVALYLSTRRTVHAIHEVGVGDIDSAPAHPREVFTAALLANAAAVIVAHNHPSGDPEPSPDDVAVTKRLVEAGRLLGVELLDHLVIGDRAYVSLRERGLV